MAVMQTPHGRVVGLIPKVNQPETPPESAAKGTATEEVAGAGGSVKAVTAKRGGRTAKK